MSLKIPPQIATSFGNQLYRAFERWLFYKAGRGKKYQNQELQHLVLAIRAHAKRHGEQAVADLIHKSIAKNEEKITFEFDTEEYDFPNGS